MPQFNYHILCTRSIDNMLVYKAANNGIAIDNMNFVETEPVITDAVVNAITTLATENKTVVFTSMNAVDAVTNQLKGIPAWNIYCVGGITKETVFNFFGEKAVKGTAKNAKALAEKMMHTGGINEVVFFCGDQRLDELPQTLAANGTSVQEVVVYKTTLLPKFVSKDYDGIVFFSPSAVHSFFSDNTISTNVVLFSIGNTTTATIKTYSANKILTSEWPGKENMIEMVIEYYKIKA
ncbi:uroporphyrinogen-III synthase [Panacibacter sp. DH6]|uniref:Uroporphyrinogen-III synthase n=1 Tax=Panacibacter microcysteis TaxID=2793269 RepID=A0A931E6T0_9BACT|nr:uroporphyrinogen-III synthase [Panacibacter microcysteis]MBG9376506.1 uroporphyrinogen-III synthase [Panacibacter microcysteis]